MIYLDNAASTPVLPQVREKLNSVLDIYGNPSSVHDMGLSAKKIIWDAKDTIAEKIGCDVDEIYFTSGATMSNNIVLQGFNDTIYYSTIEHEDIQIMAKEFGFKKLNVVSETGRVDLRYLEMLLSHNEDPGLCTIQAANGEIGTVQDIRTISRIIHSHSDKWLHVDATQYIPYYKLNIKELGIDALSMSGQKIGCIKGIGMLYISNKLLPQIKPLIYGNQGLIGGTENVIGIACLGEAFKQLDYDNKEMQRLRNMLMDGLNGKVIGDIEDRLPNNVNVYFKDVDAASIVMLLNEYGICASAGSACSSLNDDPSSTLLAIGMTPIEAKCCVRFTLNKTTTEKEITDTINITNNIVELLRGFNED